ncbi:flippase-like domain-containing protein, partial [bacterium]|nr:flippase-like domain-containing protein [bacterium]
PATTLATIAIEKIFDGLAIMTFFIIVLFFSNETKSHLYTLEEFSYRQIKIAGYIISGGYLLLMFLLILMRNQIKFLVKLPGKSKNLLSKKISIKIRNFLFSFGRGLSTFKKFKDITNIYLTSALTWIFHALIIYFCLESCNIHLTISASFFLLAFIGMAYLIPSSPGAIGTLEFFIILGLSCYGIDKDSALVFALIYHVIEIIPVCILGLYLFIKESINIKSIEV